MKCKKCQIKVDKNTTFCPNCGEKIPKKKKIKIVFLGAILFLCILILFLFFSKKEKEIEDSTEIVNDVVYYYSEENVPKFISGTFSEKSINNSKDALQALEDIKENLGFKNLEQEFVLDSEEKSENQTYYRFNQMYKNIPVYNQNIIIAVKDKKVSSFSGYYIPDINLDITPKKAKINIENKIKEKLGEESNIISNTLSIFGDFNEQSLVYVVLANTQELAKEFIVDANTGEILTETDLFSYTSVYPYVGEGMDGISYTINLEEFYDINTFKTRYRFFDSDRNISIADYRSTGMILSLAVSAIPGSTPIYVDIKENKIEENIRDKEFIKSAISAMAHYEKIYDYYKNVLERNSFDNKGSKIIVNLGVTAKSFTNQDLNNAAWYTPTSQMYIGNYNGKSFAASLDVLAHEFTHGVVSYTSKFALTPKEKDKAFETGALNEGYADIIGALVEGENWTMGEKVFLARNLENPLSLNNPSSKEGEYYYPNCYIKEYGSIETFLRAKGYENVTDYDNGGVHKNSTVPSHAAYLMYKNGAFESKEQMAKVWYNSLFLLSSYSEFEDCALAVIASAKNLGLNEDSIYIIKEAFYETKMLKEEKSVLKGTIKNKNKGIKNAKIEIYNAKTNKLILTSYSKKDGKFELKLQNGSYFIKVMKDGYKEYKKTFELEKEKNLEISLESKGKGELENSCQSNDCVAITLYYLDAGESGKTIENFITKKIDRGTILGSDFLLNALNESLDTHLKSDGKTFIVDIGGFEFDFAWYYRGTNKKFDWNQPITKDTEIEMKLFNGIFDNDTILEGNSGKMDGDTIMDFADYFSKWAQ